MDFSIYKAFASYSHTDGPLVRALLSLLAAVDVPVFRDQDHIRPGTRWRAEISGALEACEIVFVFWCSHSASSEEVQKEWLAAYYMSKRIVPVLLDDTPLDESLSEYQWIDMRDALMPAHSAHNQEAAKLFPAPPEEEPPLRAGLPSRTPVAPSMTLPEVMETFNKRVNELLDARPSDGGA